MPGVLKPIESWMQSTVNSLALVDPHSGLNVPVDLKKLPRIEEGLDVIPCVRIFRSDAPEKLVYMTFKNVSVELLLYIVVVSQGNQDLITDLDTYDNWRDQIITAFSPPGVAGSVLAGSPPIVVSVPSVWDVRVVPDVFLPSSQLNANYDYNGVGLVVKYWK